MDNTKGTKEDAAEIKDDVVEVKEDAVAVKEDVALEAKEEVQEEKMPAFLQKLLDFGVHIGRKKSMGHPKMKPYIFTTRQNVHIMNVEKVDEKLKEASEFLKGIASKGGVILFVSVVMPSKHILKEAAEELKMPYVFDRWLGGTLTNFKVISKRINYFLKQQENKAKGEFDKYTKKEQILLEDELNDLDKKIGGIKDMKSHPDAIVLIDSSEHLTVIKEAKAVGVPVVSVSSTHVDPSLTEYIIPANDRSVQSIEFIVGSLKDAINEGLKK